MRNHGRVFPSGGTGIRRLDRLGRRGWVFRVFACRNVDGQKTSYEYCKRLKALRELFTHSAIDWKTVRPDFRPLLSPCHSKTKATCHITCRISFQLK